MAATAPQKNPDGIMDIPELTFEQLRTESSMKKSGVRGSIRARREKSTRDRGSRKSSHDEEATNWNRDPKPAQRGFRRSETLNKFPKEHPDPDSNYVVREDLEVVSTSSGGVKENTTGPMVDRAFLLHHLLTKNECEGIIAVSQPYIKPVDHLFEQKYRKSNRALIRAPLLARELYQRIAPHLVGEDYKNRIPLCFGQDGVWVPLGLNDCFKVTRYDVGGLFDAHRDGPWIPREDQASIYTVVIYLNEDFLGGITELDQTHYNHSLEKREQSLGPHGIRARRFGYQTTGVTPVQGSCLMFNHDMWHSGHPVSSGVKYILRTELIMQRVHHLYVDKHAFTSDFEYQACLKLYKESQNDMIEGRKREFTEKYQNVVVMQREAMMKVIARRQELPALLSHLDDDTFATILLFLNDKDICNTCYLNHGTYYRVLQSEVWRWKIQHDFPSSVRYCDTEEVVASAKRAFQDHLPIDWYSAYSSRVLLHKRFLPSSVYFTSSGSGAVTLGASVVRVQSRRFHGGEDCFSSKRPVMQKWATRVNCSFKMKDFAVEGIPGISTVLPNGYGEWDCSYPLHMNQPDGEHFEIVMDPTVPPRSNFTKPRAPIVKQDGTVIWEVLCVPVSLLFEPSVTPLMIVGHPSWFVNQPECSINDTETMEPLFELLRSPAVHFVHPALPTVSYLMKQSGDHSSVHSTSKGGDHSHQSMATTSESRLTAVITLYHDSNEPKQMDEQWLVGVVDRDSMSVLNSRLVYNLDATKKSLLAEVLDISLYVTGCSPGVTFLQPVYQCITANPAAENGGEEEPMHSADMLINSHPALKPNLPTATGTTAVRNVFEEPPAPRQIFTHEQFCEGIALLCTSIDFREKATFRPDLAGLV